MTAQRIKEIHKRNSPDIFFLSETKNPDEFVQERFKTLDYGNCTLISPHGHGGGGLALFWKTEIQIQILSSNGHFIDTCIEFEGKSFFATFIYADTNKQRRNEMWAELTQTATNRNGPWLLSGDFNDILNNEEKKGGPERAESSFTDFRSFLSENDLYDLQHTGDPLSWRGVRYSHVVRCRLDRALANCDWMLEFPKARCHYLRYEGSDHKPIITFIDPTKKRRRGLFRFDRRLRDNEEVKTVIKQIWTEIPGISVDHRTSRVRRAIVKWNKEQQRNSNAQLEKCKQKLEEAMTDINGDELLIGNLNAYLQELYDKEEEFWRQRSRTQWLSLGDRNSGYFHAVTKGRQARNKFAVIENDEGGVFFEEDQIGEVIEKYFTGLFISQGGDSKDIVNYAIEPRISEEENQRLIQIPNAQEIKEAMLSIHPDKAPGPDGFSASFYRANWQSVGPAIVDEIREFFRTGFIPENINETHIRLIPKGHGPRKVADYRPIALCTVYYKIISKLLTRRLQPLLPQLIEEAQTAFVAGRNITDNVLITHEILHYLKTSSARKHGYMAIKTDMSKAYDRLEWNFIRNVLERLGFHDKFIGWIIQCVSTVAYSFIINGHPRGRVLPSRGIRQGDPLSPYLFILCTEVLSGLCNKAEAEGRLQGIKVAKDSPRVHHLLFADDTMFFCKTSKKNVETLKEILERYERASGQIINKQKSSITFSRKSGAEIRSRVKRELGLTKEGGCGKYLGLPEHFGRKKKDIFASIVDRIKQKILSWSTKFLSTAGKMTLLKSVLSAIPTYAMACFKLPIGLCKQIQSCLTRFWWDKKQGERKMAWTAWSTLTRRKKEGGLGFRDFQAFNEAMLAKIGWRLIENPQCLLARLLFGKYCTNQDFMNCGIQGSTSHGWRSILLGRDLLKRNMGWAIGNGKTAKIWDTWLDTSHQEAPVGPMPRSQENVTVSALINQSSKNWDLERIRDLVPHCEQKILSIKLSEKGISDKRIWLNHYSGMYSVKSGYHARINEKDREREGANAFEWNWYQHIWNAKTSPKIKMFLWKAATGALPTKERLLNRKIEENSSCSRCGELESINHILFTCEFAKQVWAYLQLEEVMPGMVFQDFRAVWSQYKNRLCLPPVGLAIPIAPWICWNIWKARNNNEFNNRSFTSEETTLKSIREAKEWSLAQVPETKSKPHSLSNREEEIDWQIVSRSDAAWKADSRVAGLGWVFFERQGRKLDQREDLCQNVNSALIGEGLAMRSAMKSALQSGYRCVKFESDSQQLIEAIKAHSPISTLHGILGDIEDMKPLFESVVFTLIKREKNSEADALAKSALKTCNQT